jgi:transposase
MRYYVGLDVSLHTTSICVMNELGATVREYEVESDAKAIAASLRGERRRYHRLGLEAGALPMSLQAGLSKAHLPAICIEARHAHGMLKSRLNKTDRNDARGIAELMRTGSFKAVHVKSLDSRQAKALLTARGLLVVKRRDMENAIGGILRSFGLKVPRGRRVGYGEMVRSLIAKAPRLEEVIDPLLQAWATIKAQLERLHERICAISNADPICQRLMTAPGVGPLVAISYRSVIDDPERFRRSRTVGSWVGLTPRTWQSGATERRGGISRCGDKALRAMLVSAAVAVLSRRTHDTDLKAWGQNVEARRGHSKALIAVARRLSVILHHMWVDGVDFRNTATA